MLAMLRGTFHREQLCRNYTHFARDCGRIKSAFSSAQLWSRRPAFHFNGI
jgi:hypothetical protein